MNTTTAIALSFPAINGDVVTEAHTRLCAERGHATHTVAGVETGRCPRCGELTAEPVGDEDRAAFDRIIDLEAEAMGLRALVQFAPAMTSDRAYAAKVRNYRTAKAAMNAAIDELTPEQGARFGIYRAANRG